MNYRHAFHAGNYGDVFKHTLLVQLLRALQRKEKGILYLDTHAGRGAYDLRAKTGPAGRAPEWPAGIGRLWNAAGLPPPLADYVALVRAFNETAGGTGAGPRFYPGSPWLAALVRRPQDRLQFWERQPGEAKSLRRRFAGMRRLTVESGDGYAALKSALPPPERRALVLIDPPFEAADEFDAILAALRHGLERFAGGVYAIWYPVTERTRVARFFAGLHALHPPPALTAELAVTAAPQVRMKACGLLVLNPPWRFADEVRSVLPALAASLGLDSGAAARCEWLVPER